MERIEVIFNSINQQIVPQHAPNENNKPSSKTLENDNLKLIENADGSNTAASGNFTNTNALVCLEHKQGNDIKWTAVLNSLAKSINAELFRAWISPLSLIEIVKIDSLVKLNLGVSSRFAKEHILREYGDRIIQSIREVYSCSNVELNFTIKAVAEKKNISTPVKVAVKKINSDSNLNQNYNFSNYVVGSCNKLAHAACTKVSEELGAAYNPLFIYGDVGLGKTHLVNAIGNAAIRRNKKVLLASSENFVSELVGSIKTNSMDKFKSKFRNLDLLIIDDIQFIIGKQRTQEEFFHTFNELFNNQKQIVITSDRIPQELTQLEDRLRTRFSCGLSVDLQAPDLETRIKIFKQKSIGLNIPDECVKLICERINSNIRELEGVLNRIKAYISINNTRIDLPIVISILDKIAPNTKSDISSDFIQEAVSSRFGVSVSDIVGKRRTQNVALARQLSMYLCREITSMSYPEIGALFGGRDHSTVIHAYKVISEKIKQSQSFNAQVAEIMSLIQGK